MTTYSLVLFLASFSCTDGLVRLQKKADDERKQFGQWGFDEEGMDASVRPGDNFFQYADGKAVDGMNIPGDRTSWGVFQELSELSENRTKAIVQHDVEKGGKIGKLYTSFMNEEQINKLGNAPLKPILEEIKAVKSHDGFAVLAGKANSGFLPSPVGVWVSEDAKHPDEYVLQVWSGGLGLPNRDYYLDDSFAEKKTAYRTHIANMLSLIDWVDANATGTKVLDLETRIANASWALAELRDAAKTYNPTTVGDVHTMVPDFNWTIFFQESGPFAADTKVVVADPSALSAIATIIKGTKLSILQAWAAAHVTMSAAGMLSKDFVDESFNFRGKVLSGQDKQKPRWKTGINLVNSQLPDAVGEIYVEKHFPASSKSTVEQMCVQLKDAFRERIAKLDWMTDTTKKHATEKLESFTIEVGYPSFFRQYEDLIVEDDLFQNVERATADDWDFWKGKLGSPVDRRIWAMPPQTVNAYNMPTFNMVVFPAAILQPPFFNPDADAAVNYGAIGAVIGHEMTHGFDDQGRMYNDKGQLSDWWTDADVKEFNKRAAKYGEQFASFRLGVPDGHSIKPDLTMGENIADLGGLTLALDAYHAHVKAHPHHGFKERLQTAARSVMGKPSQQADPSRDDRVFLGFAQVWRSKYTTDSIVMSLTSDPHPPANSRVIIPTRNIDAWYDAFDVKASDKFYLDASDRVKIW